MNTPQPPSVELIQGTPQQHAEPSRGRRWKIFFGVLVLAVAVGVTFVYSRSPVYRATASVLTVKPKDVDTRSADADVEHVAIQTRLLLGQELLGRLSQQLAEQGDDNIAGLDRLRNMLAVIAVPDTNLLELRAEGEQPEQLQRVVNRWAESYEVFRAEEIEAASGRTISEIEDQQPQLKSKIEAARSELLAFREAHDIVSLERSENRSLASLRGLNDSLNKAREQKVEARARVIAIDEAIARGETVIPNEQKADVAAMQRFIENTRARMADLEQNYTQRYIERDPALKSLPAQLRSMENELALTLRQARQTVRDEALQALQTAEVSVNTLEQQLTEHQRKVQQFTDRFKEFKALEEGLKRLEVLYADNEQRLAQIQVRNLEKFPPIQVVEWARVPDRPIYPDYERDLLIALAGALGLALFVTWLVEYLGERSRPAQNMPYVGVRIISGGEQAQALDAPQPDRRLAQEPPAASAAPPANLPILPRELAGAEIKSLMAVAAPITEAYAALLLSGVAPYELPMLHIGCFDRSAAALDVPGASQRRISLAEGAWWRLQPLLDEMSAGKMPMPTDQLDQLLTGSARDAQLADPGGIGALALWHSYVLYLVRQGIDSSALSGRVGAIPPDVHGTLMHFAPPGGNRPLRDIEFVHPILAG